MVGCSIVSLVCIILGFFLVLQCENTLLIRGKFPELIEVDAAVTGFDIPDCSYSCL